MYSVSYVAYSEIYVKHFFRELYYSIQLFIYVTQCIVYSVRDNGSLNTIKHGPDYATFERHIAGSRLT